MKTWQVWMEGYCASGDSAKASFKGEFKGETFADACVAWSKKLNPSARSSFDKERLEYWGCRLFDNEADARKAFG